MTIQNLITSNSPLAGFFSVPVLYARRNSVYKSLPGADVFDENRDAFTFEGSSAVVAHPPCRLWGRLRTFSKADNFEKYCALHAVIAVQQNGGILEHPSFSTLWRAAALPAPGAIDEHGGFTLPILQSWFGHKAPKATWLYIVGITPGELPVLPFELGIPSGRVAKTGSMKLREGTPLDLAIWLLEVARLIESKKANLPASLLNNKRSFANGLAQC